MGGVWQAIVFGFAGVRAHDGVLDLDPRLPSRWERLCIRLRFRGRRLQLIFTSDAVEVLTDGPVTIHLPGRAHDEVHAPGRQFAFSSGRWESRTP